MRSKPFRFLATGACTLLISCAFITVNVYFPEKDVKKAFKTLDEKYLESTPSSDVTPPSENSSEPASLSPVPTEPSRQ